MPDGEHGVAGHMRGNHNEINRYAVELILLAGKRRVDAD